MLNSKGYQLLPILIETMVKKIEMLHTLTGSIISNSMTTDSFSGKIPTFKSLQILTSGITSLKILLN